MKVYHQLFIYNKKEKLKYKNDKTQSRSFLKPFLYLLCPIFNGSMISTIDIYNTARTTLYTNYINFIINSQGRESYVFYNASASQVGIVVGEGTNAVAITDYKLQTKITNGASAGQLVYLSCWLCNLAVGASDVTWDIERMFYNDSGGTITINELGVNNFAQITGQPSYTQTSFCMIRDKLSVGVDVADTEYLKVKYTLSVSV